MIINPRWLIWLEEDEEGFLTILKEDTPDDIKKEYEQLSKEEQNSVKKNKLKSTIF